jgi:hypothetical protein
VLGHLSDLLQVAGLKQAKQKYLQSKGNLTGSVGYDALTVALQLQYYICDRKKENQRTRQNKSEEK